MKVFWSGKGGSSSGQSSVPLSMFTMHSEVWGEGEGQKSTSMYLLELNHFNVNIIDRCTNVIIVFKISILKANSLLLMIHGN